MDAIRAYGVEYKELKTAQRAYFFIGKDGTILWKHVMDNPRERLDNETILEKIRPLAQ
jgi:peroxiredoxin